MTALPVFLDRDGVINKNSADYVRSMDQWVPLPGAIEAVVRLCRAGYPVFVVTNQSAIARGYSEVSEVQKIHRNLIQLVEEAGGSLAGIYYCPHHPDDDCDCRKPRTGMIETARMDNSLPAGGYIVGDADSDMELGRRAGLKTILVLTGRGRDQLRKIESEDLPRPWKVTEGLPSAVDMILSDIPDDRSR